MIFATTFIVMVSQERRMKLFFFPTKVNIGGIKINSPDHLSSVSQAKILFLVKNVACKKIKQMADLTIVGVPIFNDH